jgi:hypothetical protein
MPETTRNKLEPVVAGGRGLGERAVKVGERAGFGFTGGAGVPASRVCKWVWRSFGSRGRPPHRRHKLLANIQHGLRLGGHGGVAAYGTKRMR